MSTQTLPLGEFVCWEFAPKQQFQHSELVRCLAHAKLDWRYARDLCTRFAFGRAVKLLGEQKLVKNVVNAGGLVTFQLNHVIQAGGRIDYPLDCQITLDTGSDLLSCSDPATLVKIQALLNACVGARTIDDVCRLLCRMIEDNCSLVVPFRKGSRVYFVPECYSAFVDQLEAFVLCIHGTFKRADQQQTPKTVASVAIATADALEDRISEYEKDIEDLRKDPTERKIKTAWQSVNLARDLIHQRRELLTYHATVLEDHVALCEHLLRSTTAPSGASLSTRLVPGPNP